MTTSFRVPQTVRRSAPGAYVDGVWVPGSETTMTIMASVQPVNDRELSNMPEGRRTSDMVKIYSDTVLLTVEDAGSNQQPDILEWYGSDYEVTAVSVRQMNVINHYRYYARKKPNQAGT